MPCIFSVTVRESIPFADRNERRVPIASLSDSEFVCRLIPLIYIP